MKKTRMIVLIAMLIIILGGSVYAASANVSCSASKVTVGQNVSVTVSFGQKVSAAQFSLDFNSDKFEYVSKSGAGSFSASTKKYGYVSEDGVTADLSSVTFTFKAKTNGSANFSMGGLKISTETETKVTPGISNSSVSVTAETKKEEPTPTPNPKPTPKPNTNTAKNTNTNTNTSVENTIENVTNQIEENNTIMQNQVLENQIDNNVVSNTSSWNDNFFKIASIVELVIIIAIIIRYIVVKRTSK